MRITICVLILLMLSSGIIPEGSDESAHVNLADEIQFDCVGQVVKVDSDCGSFVLINDSTILSAAHNFVNSKNPKLDSTINLNLFKFIIDSSEYIGTDITIHPSYFIDSLCTGHDLAIIRLNQKVQRVKPAILNQTANELNEKVITVGYGVFMIAGSNKIGTNRKIAGENIVDSLSNLGNDGKMYVLNCDFDSPNNSACNKTGSATALNLETGLTGGDSGGGLFIEVKGEWYLIGISSKTKHFTSQSNCVDYGQLDQWTRIKTNYNWIVNSDGM